MRWTGAANWKPSSCGYSQKRALCQPTVCGECWFSSVAGNSGSSLEQYTSLNLSLAGILLFQPGRLLWALGFRAWLNGLSSSTGRGEHCVLLDQSGGQRPGRCGAVHKGRKRGRYEEERRGILERRESKDGGTLSAEPGLTLNNARPPNRTSRF